MLVGGPSKPHGTATGLSPGGRSRWSNGRVGGRARAVHDTTAVGTNIHNVGLVGGTNKSSTINSTEAVGALDVDPSSTAISAAIQLLTLRTVAEDVQVPGSAITLAD